MKLKFTTQKRKSALKHKTLSFALSLVTVALMGLLPSSAMAGSRCAWWDADCWLEKGERDAVNAAKSNILKAFNNIEADAEKVVIAAEKVFEALDYLKSIEGDWDRFIPAEAKTVMNQLINHKGRSNATPATPAPTVIV